MKKAKKWIAVSMCAATLCACITPIIKFKVGKAADKVVWDDVSIQEQYVVDDTFNIPVRSVLVGENTYDADVKIRYPDGTVRTTAEEEMVLSSAGIYTLIYEAKDAKLQYYKDEVPFTVADKLWKVSNPKSTISYGKVGDTSALIVGLARGDTLTFNKVIDVSTLETENTMLFNPVGMPNRRICTT